VRDVYAGEINISAKRMAAILMYSAWNIRKERNQRTFEGSTPTLAQVLGLIKEELGILSRAIGKLDRVTFIFLL